VKTIEYKGRKFVYAEYGDSSKEPFLFIHGWGVSPFTYKDSIQELSSHFHVLAPYIQGVDDLKASSDTLAQFMDAQKVSSAVVLGHSFSGIVAAGLAYYYPKKVKALVLIDTIGIDFGRSNFVWLITWFRHVLTLLVGRNRYPVKSLRRIAIDFTFHILFYPHLLFREVRFMLKINLSKIIEKLSMPILVLEGKDDVLVPKEVGEKIVKLNPKAQLKIMPGGHNWSKVDVEVLSREVTEFVNSL